MPTANDHIFDSTLTAKGQTTVPLVIRSALKAQAGSKLRWTWHPNGSINVKIKTGSHQNLIGMLTPPCDSDLNVDDLKV